MAKASKNKLTIGGFTMKKLIALSVILGLTSFLGACASQESPSDTTAPSGTEQTAPGSDPTAPTGTESPAAPDSTSPESTAPGTTDPASDPTKSETKEEPSDAGSMTAPQEAPTEPSGTGN
ncbi:hypothetical protein NIES593_12115 [Hydrococcus rivularis NIES-593]|uniref:Uncharacterized protein n=2 Tax=Hydrococcus TaxID=1616833 RepID=A0A1U7HG32_9CYAN|nr:hypothetical protein NIES593_12115 [Hydrococcus rivularis NIES-593]